MFLKSIVKQVICIQEMNFSFKTKLNGLEKLFVKAETIIIISKRSLIKQIKFQSNYLEVKL